MSWTTTATAQLRLIRLGEDLPNGMVTVLGGLRLNERVHRQPGAERHLRLGHPGGPRGQPARIRPGDPAERSRRSRQTESLSPNPEPHSELGPGLAPGPLS